MRWQSRKGPPSPRLAAEKRRGYPASRMRLALYQPDIPQNTGTILRLAACLGVGVDVIGPTAFDMTDRALRRAALDYLPHVQIARHATFAAFEEARQARGSRLVLLTTGPRWPIPPLPSSAMTPCCSAAKALGCPRRYTGPPMRACASACNRACAPSMSRSRPRWCLAKPCGSWAPRCHRRWARLPDGPCRAVPRDGQGEIKRSHKGPPP